MVSSRPSVFSLHATTGSPQSHSFALEACAPLSCVLSLHGYADIFEVEMIQCELALQIVNQSQDSTSAKEMDNFETDSFQHQFSDVSFENQVSATFEPQVFKDQPPQAKELVHSTPGSSEFIRLHSLNRPMLQIH